MTAAAAAAAAHVLFARNLVLEDSGLHHDRVAGRPGFIRAVHLSTTTADAGRPTGPARPGPARSVVLYRAKRRT